MEKRIPRATVRALVLVSAACLLHGTAHEAQAQDRLRGMPGHAQYEQLAGQVNGSVRLGTLAGVSWHDDGRGFDYSLDGTRYRYNIAARSAQVIDAPAQADGLRGMMGRGVERGRQFDSAMSPDSSLRAFYRDRNLWVSSADGSGERAITTDGSAAARTKYGTGSWVYGEELRQNTAIWWSPDGRRVAYYWFDESGVTDYFLQLDQTKLQSSIDVEAYPKAGTPNPLVEIFVHDSPPDSRRSSTSATASRSRRRRRPLRVPRRLDAGRQRDHAEPHEPPPEHHGVHGVRARHRPLPRHRARGMAHRLGHELAADAVPRGRPPLPLDSERTGFRNIYLYDLSGRLLSHTDAPRVRGRRIVRVDEQARQRLVHGAQRRQLPEAAAAPRRLDGRGDRRLTDPAFHHTVSIAPDGRHFIDVAQTHDRRPSRGCMTRGPHHCRARHQRHEPFPRARA
jgi:dipeptidyl-peptidase 4